MLHMAKKCLVVLAGEVADGKDEEGGGGRQKATKRDIPAGNESAVFLVVRKAIFHAHMDVTTPKAPPLWSWMSQEHRRTI
jgi:hypothetical protein